nr:prolyl oligopeptidase family serine peptidase [Chloroflexota bacterium]
MKYLAFLLSVAVMSMLVGCTSAGHPSASPVVRQVALSPTHTATATPIAPTSTPTATASPVPATATPSPTATPSMSPSPTPRPWSGQQACSTTVQVEGAGGMTEIVQVHYLLYLPQDYRQEEGRKWPLVLFLHGSEERGENPGLLKREGLPKMLEGRPDFPAVVISPQCPQGKRWVSRVHILGAFLDQVQSLYAIDAERVYLTGISMGAYGAWALALRYPQRFAAMVPIAGGANAVSDEVPQNMCDLKELPIWVFHGRLDQNVPYTDSEKAVLALQECGGNVRFTLYDDAAHTQAWERAYADEELYAWLFAQQR